MSVYKEPKTNTWKVYYRYTDWQGERKQTTKRGFATKREALAWEREQMHKTQSDLDMTFKSFVEVYTADVKSRIKENTWHTKEHIIRTKLLPYFGKRKIAEIQPKDILAWQNEMLNSRDKNGRPYSPVYLKTVHTQLSTIFNHACKFYGLRENPAMKVGNMGKAKNREMLIWTREEYEKFSFAVMDKPLSFYAFEMIRFVGCSVYPQGYPAIVNQLGAFNGINLLADIGNGTMNILYINDRKPMENRCWTEKLGVNQCMIAAKNAVMDSFGVKIDDLIVEQVLRHGTADISKPYLDCIAAAARRYVADIFATLRKYEYNPNLMRLYIVGGGGCLVRYFGDYAEDRVTILNDICATAKGYEYLAYTVLRKKGGA